MLRVLVLSLWVMKAIDYGVDRLKYEWAFLVAQW